MKDHEKENIEYVLRMERKQEFHFHHFFALLGGAISNDALMVINNSFEDIFPKGDRRDSIYGRFMSTR